MAPVVSAHITQHTLWQALTGEFLTSSNPDDAGNLLLCGKL